MIVVVAIVVRVWQWWWWLWRCMCDCDRGILIVALTADYYDDTEIDCMKLIMIDSVYVE